MKHLIALAFAGLLVGCSVDNPTENNYDITLVGEYGVTLLPSERMWVSFEEVVGIYESTMTCLGLTAPGPTVEYKSFAENFLGGAWGLYHAGKGGYVFINIDEKDPSIGFPARSKDTDTQVLRHEFVHHILAQNDLPYHDGESTELFRQCGLGVQVNN